MTDIFDRLRRAMDEGPIIAYFGYGSLVNRTTLRTTTLPLNRCV